MILAMDGKDRQQLYEIRGIVSGHIDNRVISNHEYGWKASTTVNNHTNNNSCQVGKSEGYISWGEIGDPAMP